MYSLKLAQLIRDYVGAEVHEFYRDMRAFGKDYEAFYTRVTQAGVQFYRYDEDIQVRQQDGQLVVSMTNMYTGALDEVPVDMVLLSTGMEAQPDAQQVAATFGISRSPDGFFLEKHPKLAPVDTATDGVYLAGTCQGPKDIPDSVAQGSAAAAAALSLMDAGRVFLEPFTAYIDPALCSGCLTCIGLCPYHAIQAVEIDRKVVSQVNEILCKGCGACVAACPAGVAVQHGFTNEQIFAEIDGVLMVGVLEILSKMPSKLEEVSA
jgi:heterodisulfide reductase subunit A